MPTAYVFAHLPPAGVYPAVAYEPGIAQATPIVPPAALADDIAPDGDLATLYVGPGGAQAQGLIHPVDAAIKEAFRLFADTGAAVVGKGQRFLDIKKNDQAAARRMTDEANRILAPFVRRGDIAIVAFEVDTGIAFDLGALLVRYRNLRTGEEQTVRPPG